MTTCSTCKNWDWESRHSMRDANLAVCQAVGIWLTTPPQKTCPKHEPVSTEVERQRRAWLEKAV